MLPARYEAQKLVRACHQSQRCEAERWRLAKAVRRSQGPAAGGLLSAVTQAMCWTGSVAKAGLDAIRAWSAGSPEPQQESC
jgi:hypothetical protein